MCLLLNWKIVHCELYVFSFSFVHAPVCANCNYSCKLLYSKKKTKKTKKTKNKKDPYFGMGKNTKVMPQKPRYLSFLLEKGGNPYISKTLHKKLSKSALSALPPSMQKHSDSDTVWTTHVKINQN